MQRPYYKIAPVADSLNRSVDSLLYLGIEEILPISFLTSCFTVFAEEQILSVNPDSGENEEKFIASRDINNVVETEHLVLSIESLKKLYAGGVNCIADAAPVENGSNRLVHFSLFSPDGKRTTLGECELIIMHDDLAKYRKILRKENRIANESSLETQDMTKTTTDDAVPINERMEGDPTATASIDIQVVGAPDHGDIVKEHKVKPPCIYDSRKASFETWKTESDIDLVEPTIESIFNMLVLHYNNNKTWNIQYSTFYREFWQRYSNEIGLEKQSGAPPKNNKISK